MLVYAIFGEFYSILKLIFNFVLLGEERDEIYPFLNYAEDYASAFKFDMFMTFGVQSAVFFFIFALSHAKFFIHRKCLSKGGVQCRDRYCGCFEGALEQGCDQESQEALNESVDNRQDGFVSKAKQDPEGFTNHTYDVSYKSLPHSEL